RPSATPPPPRRPSTRTASGQLTLSWRIGTANTCPPAPHPKQWKMPSWGLTWKEGVFSSWNGHRPLKLRPAGLSATWRPTTSTRSARLRIASIVSSGMRPIRPILASEGLEPDPLPVCCSAGLLLRRSAALPVSCRSSRAGARAGCELERKAGSDRSDPERTPGRPLAGHLAQLLQGALAGGGGLLLLAHARLVIGLAAAQLRQDAGLLDLLLEAPKRLFA